MIYHRFVMDKKIQVVRLGFFGSDGEIHPLRYRSWHAPDLCDRSLKGRNSASRIGLFESRKL
ncbi:MAG: hypothetical protein E7561_01655 [Ruminococcaceae bacterium]|nr:hypothetical protein [Oscillospiraceae bacterium]